MKTPYTKRLLSSTKEWNENLQEYLIAVRIARVAIGSMTAVDFFRMSRAGSHRLPLQYRKTPPESWPGWLRFRWSSRLDQDGVDLSGGMSSLIGNDVLIRDSARACRVVIYIVLLIVNAVGLR